MHEQSSLPVGTSHQEAAVEIQEDYADDDFNDDDSPKRAYDADTIKNQYKNLKENNQAENLDIREDVNGSDSYSDDGDQ